LINKTYRLEIDNFDLPGYYNDYEKVCYSIAEQQYVEKQFKWINPFRREQVLLRFPQLGSIARVFINGKEVAIVWCSSGMLI
jgi:hypothetical protein